MKQTTLIKSAILAGSALLAGLASAGDDPAPAAPSSALDVSFGVGYTNEYVFRGVNRGDDLFAASIGVAVSGSALGLDLDLSAGLELLSWTAQRGGNEMRINMEASQSLGSFDLAVGVTNYFTFSRFYFSRLCR